MDSMQNDLVPGRTGNAHASPPPVRAALVSAEGMTTESLARERRLSDSLGIPPRMLRPNMDKAEREVMARRILADPVLARYAGMSPEHAALVRDDEQGLLNVVTSLASSGWREIKEGTTDIGEAWNAGKRQMELADLGNRLVDGDESALPLIAEWYRREGSFKERDTWADTIGLTSATTQLPRMLFRDLPTSGLYALGGGVTGLAGGAAVGSAFGGVGAGPGGVIGFRLGGKAGWLAGTAKTSYEAERGSFAAELSQLRDEGGNLLAPEIRNAAASLYGAASAGVETLGEAVFLKILSPLAGRTLSKLGVKPVLRSAIKNAIWDKSVQAALLDVSRRIAGGALAEGVEEGVQQLISIITKSQAQRRATAEGVNSFADRGLVPAGSGEEIFEAGKEGFLSGLWLSGAPTAVLGVAQVQEARRTAAWTQAQKALKATIDQTKVQAASPELSEGFLQSVGLSGDVTLPADAVLELREAGTDILTPLGMKLEDLREAADAGQEVVVPLARLHARLDEATFAAVADIMRPAPDAMNMQDAAALNENLSADMDGLVEAAEEYAIERSAIEGELERLRIEMTEAVKSIPHLMAQIVSDTDADTTVGRYVDAQLGLLIQRARALNRMGIPISETLSRVSFQGLVRDDAGRLVTPEEAEAYAQQRAEEEALAPFWDTVWGRLNADGLRGDFSEARRELAYRHGRGLFARKGEGPTVDELVDELKNRGLLEEDADSSTLIERLKELPRPKRKSADRRGQVLFQEGDKGVTITQRDNGGEIKLADGSYINWRKEDDLVEVEDEYGNIDYEPMEYMLIAGLYVAPESRRKGVARKLLRSALARIKAQYPDMIVKLSADPIADMAVPQENLVSFYGTEDFKTLDADGMSGVPMEWSGILIRRGDEDMLFQAAPATDSTAFKTWFGNSQVVDENGEPLIVYHSSYANFGEDFVFDASLLGENTIGNATDPAWAATSTVGFWANTKRLDIYSNAQSVYYKIENPKEFYSVEELAEELRGYMSDDTHAYDAAEIRRVGQEFADALKSEGYDGLIVHDEEFGDTSYVAFSPEQIKAVNNHGTWNPADPRIFYQSAYQGRNTSLGSTRPDADGNYVIQLFRSANLSTLTHETAHVFFLEMERLEREGLADEKMLADLAALREWTSVLDDDATLKADYDRFMKHSVAAYGGAEFERLPAWLKEDARNRAKQEMLARGFEQYLREGKAPSRKLESVFTRFRKWLMRVYREALTLHVELTDEVRDVFDRMLAHEEEMDLKAEAAGARDETARLLDALDLKGAKRLEIEGLITEAKAEAAEKLRRARDENRLKLLRGWAKEAKEQMEREKVYVARKAIRRTPIDLASFNDVNGEELGKALVKKLPGSATRREGGVEPETLAAELGYESAADMARDIVNSPTPGQRVKQIVDERQAEHDALFDADDYLFEQEQLAEQQERIAAALEEKMRAITAEQRYRREVAGKTVGGEEVRPTAEDYEDFGPLARWRVGRDQLRAQALTVLSKKPMGEEVLPEQFRRAASRWMQEERRAVLRGDFGKALEANYKARLNIELAGRAAERRDLVNKLTKRTKKFLDMDKADPDARYATFWLAQNIGLFSPTRKMLANAGDKNRQNVDAFFARMREEGLLGQEDIDIWLFAEERRSWKGMTWEEFRPYAEAMTIIMHMERESRTANTAQGRVDLEAKAKEIAASIYANNAHREPGALVKRSKAGKLLRKIHAAHLKADTIALLLDGDSMGPAYAAIMRPINEATWNRAERLRQGRDALKKLFSVYSRRELVEMKSKRFTVPGVAAPITKEQALGVLLNSGNASNLQRLMSGQKLTRDQVQAIIDTLDERDVRFAQSVWDYFETFRKESFDLEESLTGVRPEAVKAQPVQTRFGMLRGGYYPVVYDTDLSALPADQDKVGTQTSGRVASVDHGSMKQRTATGLGTPLALSLDVIPRHVSETAHMLAFRRPVLEVGKILRRKEVNGAIQETAGVEIAKALRDWLAYVAGERPARTGWNKAASWARKNAALYALGFKLSTMLAQMTGLLATTSEIGLKWTLRGVANTYGRGNPLEVYRTVMALSPMMRNRITSIDRDVFEASSKLMDTGSTHRALDPFVRMKSFMETKGFVPIGVIQMAFSDLPTWNGAYAKALTENGGDIEAAARYADAVVERTQVGGAEKDLAAVQRGSELGKLMTMFYSYFSALYNLSARRVTMLHRRRDAASVYRLATLVLLTWFAEPVLMGTLLGKAPDDEGDDWEDWLSWGAKEAFFNPFNMVVGVRDAASMVDSYVSGYSGRYRLSSALDVFDSAMKFGIQAGKILEGGGDEKELVLAGGKAVGQATGFVNAQALLILETFWDWLDGTSPELELGNLIRKKN